MIRVLNLVAIMAVILSSFGLYRVKQSCLKCLIRGDRFR